MSFKALSWAFEQEITTTAPQSHVFLAMANYANEHDYSYPSIKTIARKTRLNDKTVRKSLQELCDLKLLLDLNEVSQFGSKVYKICYEHEVKNVQNTDTTPYQNRQHPPTKNGSTTEIGTPTKNGSTTLPNLPLPPTKNGSTPLPNLVDNPVSKPVREPVSKPVSKGKPKMSYAPPENLAPTQSQIERCAKHGLNANELFNHFLNYCQANGKGYVDWSAGFTTWITNAIKWDKPKSQSEQSKKSNLDFSDYGLPFETQKPKQPTVIDVTPIHNPILIEQTDDLPF